MVLWKMTKNVNTTISHKGHTSLGIVSIETATPHPRQMLFPPDTPLVSD